MLSKLINALAPKPAPPKPLPINLDAPGAGVQLIEGPNYKLNRTIFGKLFLDISAGWQPLPPNLTTIDSNYDPAIVGALYWCQSRSNQYDKQISIWMQNYSNPNEYDLRIPSFFQYGYAIHQTAWTPTPADRVIVPDGKSTQNFVIPAVPIIDGLGFTGAIILTGV